MRKIFTKETLKRSFKPSFIIIILCLGVWLWGRYQKVDIDLHMLPQIASTETPNKIDFTILDSDKKVATSLSQPIHPQHPIVQQRLSLRPGEYQLRGIISTTSGTTHVVEQTITVPDSNATIEVYLRPPHAK